MRPKCQKHIYYIILRGRGKRDIFGEVANGICGFVLRIAVIADAVEGFVALVALKVVSVAFPWRGCAAFVCFNLLKI